MAGVGAVGRIGRIGVSAIRTALVPTPGYIFLVDGDGALLPDGDGRFLEEPI